MQVGALLSILLLIIQCSVHNGVPLGFLGTSVQASPFRTNVLKSTDARGRGAVEIWAAHKSTAWAEYSCAPRLVRIHLWLWPSLRLVPCAEDYGTIGTCTTTLYTWFVTEN